MTEPLGLSIGMTNLVAARVGRPPVIRRAILTLFPDRAPEVGVPAEKVAYVDLGSAAQRVGLSRDRPLLAVNPRAMLRTMLEDRAPLYREVATATVPTSGREPDDVVVDVLAVVRGGEPR